MTAGTYLDELNDQQRAAVEYIDGPQLVIAGAGSGKTRVLTYKVMHLLAKGYEPWRIMALTFTNKAATEMRERITAKLGADGARRITMGTFHSVFARILRAHADRIGYSSNFTIYDAQDAKNLVKAIIRHYNLDEKVYKPNTIANIISGAKNALISPAMYAADTNSRIADKRAGRDMTATLYADYCERLRLSNSMDFDDLLYNTFRLLDNNPDIRNHYNELYRYILVDEYQDTNYAQHRIIELMAGKNPGLCVVGDDAQSIYSFRGANLANILGLERSFPGLHLFKLEQNYRSTENIINAAGSLITHNTEQIPKNVFSRNGAGNRVEVIQCYSDFEEAGLLATKIAEVKARTGDPFDDFAVLYRTNGQSRILEESLRKRNIPYRIYGGLSFFQRKEVKDAVAYMRLALNVEDDESLRRIVNVPARKIGETTMKKVIDVALNNGVSIYSVINDMDRYPVDVNKPTRKRLEDFAALLDRMAAYATEHDAAQTLEYIFVQSGLVEMYTSDTTPENISKQENLSEFNNYAVQFVENKMEQGLDDEMNLSSFMTEVSLATDFDKNENAETDEHCVTLMTIHAAKGLEFGNVFVVGVEKNLLPSMMSTSTPREIEEERRLLYVAITRAKRYCMLSYAKSRYMNGASTVTGPSPFLSEIDGQYLKLATGTRLTADNPSVPSLEGTPTFRSPRTTYGGQLMDRYHSAQPRVAPRTHQSASQHTPRPMASTAANAADVTLHAASELRAGMRIMHPRFQDGTITAIDASHPQGARINVSFRTEGDKILLLKFARFAIIPQ